MYDKLVKKVNTINTSGLVKKKTKKKKTDCDANISDVEGKIPSITDLATNADFNAV